MKWLFIAFAWLVAAPALAPAKAGRSSAMTPDDRAQQWLSLMDDRNYADAYDQMGDGARGKMAAGRSSAISSNKSRHPPFGETPYSCPNPFRQGSEKLTKLTAT